MFKEVRVRFAPSPTGFMHLGNVRAALVNYLFAKQKNGTFILRIEDTDTQRNIDPDGKQIIEDLNWLNLAYNEGPIKGGPYEPYYQSKRSEIYQKYLETLKSKNLVYRCFCSVEELEKKRKRQLALKMPPHYDRTCLKLSQEDINKNLAANIPFIWRFKLDETKTIYFYDLAHKEMHFELKNFSDIPLTRQDGSFTFMFANFVDDHIMKITHVFRGEDHLTNTAGQIALYQAFDATIPVFWHLPIIGNKDGKKLSKRDFGFSLTDLKDAGFVPEAICNYLAIIGGGSFDKEIMNADELIHAINFDQLSPTGMIRYDIEKLKWVNHHWIMQYPIDKLVTACKPFLATAYPEIQNLNPEKLEELIKHVQQEIVTLKDSVTTLEFYFKKPQIDNQLLSQFNIDKHRSFLTAAINQIKNNISNAHESVVILKNLCKEQNVPIKDIFSLIRIALTGKSQGLGIGELLEILGSQESLDRLKALVQFS